MTINGKDLFLQELKAEYNAQFELSNSLEGKSGQLITVCGIVIPLLFGFSAFLIDKIENNHDLVISVEILLVITLSLVAASIFFSVWGLRIQFYRHAFLPNYFYNKNGTLDQERINEFAKNADDFYDQMIEEYLASNKQNLETNDKKARKIEIAQYLFLIGLAIVPILVAISFSFPPVKN